MRASNEKARRANAGRNFELYINATNDSITRSAIEPARLSYFAGRLHELGERLLYEFLWELAEGADLGSTLNAYARIDAGTYATLIVVMAEAEGRAQ